MNLSYLPCAECDQPVPDAAYKPIFPEQKEISDVSEKFALYFCPKVVILKPHQTD